MVTLLAETASAYKVGLFKRKDGIKVYYTVLTLFPFIKTEAYPAIIAFPGGRQNSKVAKAAITEFWGPEARKCGYFVFVPEPPKGYRFYQRGVFLAPELIEHFKKKFKTKGKKFHIAGNSNDSLSAFGIALKNHKRISSLTSFPGFSAFTLGYYRLTRLTNVKTNLFVNEKDERWANMTEFTYECLNALGFDVTFEKFGDDGHTVKALAGANAKKLFDIIER